jgi:hypothetical protein
MIDVPQLVTIEEAKGHLRANGVPIDVQADIQSKLDQATAIILDYLNTTAHWRAITATWTEQTLPAPVHAAILLQVADLFAWRGDARAERDDELAPGVAGILRRMRDPVIA